MPWIESHTGLRENKKVRDLCMDLGATKPHVIGHLHMLWHMVLVHAETGDISGWNENDVAHYAEWDGDPKKFLEALVRHRFLDQVDGRLFAHDWFTYAGKYLWTKYHSKRPDYYSEVKEMHERVKTAIEARPDGDTVPLPIGTPDSDRLLEPKGEPLPRAKPMVEEFMKFHREILGRDYKEVWSRDVKIVNELVIWARKNGYVKTEEFVRCVTTTYLRYRKDQEKRGFMTRTGIPQMMYNINLIIGFIQKGDFQK